MSRLDAPLTYSQAREGREPAEVLSEHDRKVLMVNLVRGGLTDWEISSLTRWTLYTVARIRDGLNLPPNHPNHAAA